MAKLVVLGMGLAIASLSACSGSNRPSVGATGGEGGDETGGSGGSTGGKGGSGGGLAGTGGTGGDAGSGGSGGTGGGDTGGTGGDAGSGGDDAGVEPDAAPEVDAAPKPDAAPPVPAPTPWMGKDIGAVGMLLGYENTTAAANDSERITVYGGGTTGIGGKADAFHFVSRPITGDAEMIGRVTSLSMVDPNTTAGLMIRESLDPDAAMVFLGPIADGKTGGRVVVRTKKGGDAALTPTDPTMTLPELKASQWIRLVRTGATVRIYAGTRLGVSDDSASLGQVTLTLAKPTAPLYFGMATTSNSDMKPASGRFEDVMISNLSTDTTTAKWTTQTFGISGGAALWNKTDLEVTGLGQPWNGAPDKSRDFFQYAFFRPDVKNDSHTSLQFLVTSQDKTDPNGRVAAMYRVAADMNGFNRSNATVALSLTQGMGLVLEVRTAAGEKFPLVVGQTKADLKAPLWLRLDRQLAALPGDSLGRLFTQVRAYYATDNKGTPGKWNAFGDVTNFISVGPADFASLGIAVGSYAPVVPNTAVISKVTVGPAPAPPPVVFPPDAGASEPDAGAAD